MNFYKALFLSSALFFITVAQNNSAQTANTPTASNTGNTTTGNGTWADISSAVANIFSPSNSTQNSTTDPTLNSTAIPAESGSNSGSLLMPTISIPCLLVGTMILG